MSFGSAVSGLFLKGSDLDLTIVAAGMNGSMDGRMDGWNGWIYSWMDEFKDGLMGERVEGWMMERGREHVYVFTRLLTFSQTK